MTIRHLKIFLAVAETGKMSAAAQQLYITQPSVSQAVRELEEHYGVLLFERLSKKLYITRNGKLFYNYAKQVVSQFDLMEENMSKKRLRESLRIGATISVGGSILSYIVKDFRAQAPKVDVYAYLANTRGIEQKLLNMELDVGIIEGKVKHPELVSIPMIDDILVLACSREHPFFTRDAITVKELENQEFVMREIGSGTRELFENYLEKHHASVKIVFEENTPDSIKKAILINNCLSVISARLIAQEIQQGQMRPFCPSEKQWNRSFSFVYHKDKYISKAIELLQDIVRSYGLQKIKEQISCGKLLDS